MIDFKFDLQRFDSAFSGGSGTEADPYLIGSLADLEQFRNDVDGGNNYEGKYLKVTADIKLSSEWKQIGYSYRPFNGTFDGDGHTIRNLKISTDKNGIGLFCYNKGTIKNITLENVDLSGNNRVGGLVGVNKGTIKNVTLENFNISGNDRIGGLVGYNYSGTVTDNTVNGKVSGSSAIGGLIGYNKDGTVKGNTVNSTVSGSWNFGGIVGRNGEGTVKDNTYYSNAGAVGSGNGIVENNIRLYKLTAALPEGVTSSSLVTLNGTTYIKGGEVTFNYYGDTYNYNVTGDVTVTLKDNKIFANDTELGVTFPLTLSGDGSENNPYLLKSENHLRQLAGYVNSGNNCAGLNFKLANDIALTGEWTPIGTYYYKFGGNFDGDGKTVGNLTISGGSNLGLFSYVDNATIKNVKLTDVNISGRYRLGAVVASADNNSQILNCSASGNIKVNSMCSYGGGVVGRISNGGKIDGCTFSGNIEGIKAPAGFVAFSPCIGGIVGNYTDGTIKNCAYLGGTLKSTISGAIVSRITKTESLVNNYYYGRLDEGIADSGATQIFKATLPEGVTSSSLVEINGTKYIKAGDVTLNYNGQSYSYNVSADLTVTLQDDKLSFDEQSTNEGLKLYASDNGDTLTGGTGNDSLWGGAGKDTFVHNGGHDIIYGFGKGDTLKINGLDDITATYDTADNDIKIPCGTGSVTLKDFTTNEFPINNDTWTLSGNTLTKQ